MVRALKRAPHAVGDVTCANCSCLLSVCVFACLCLFAGRLSARLHACRLVCSAVCLFVCLFVRPFVCLCGLGSESLIAQAAAEGHVWLARARFEAGDASRLVGDLGHALSGVGCQLHKCFPSPRICWPPKKNVLSGAGAHIAGMPGAMPKVSAKSPAKAQQVGLRAQGPRFLG